MPDLSVCARWLLGGGVEEGVHNDPRSACGLMTVRGEGTGRCTWGGEYTHEVMSGWSLAIVYVHTGGLLLTWYSRVLGDCLF